MERPFKMPLLLLVAPSLSGMNAIHNGAADEYSPFRFGLPLFSCSPNKSTNEEDGNGDHVIIILRFVTTICMCFATLDFGLDGISAVV